MDAHGCPPPPPGPSHTGRLEIDPRAQGLVTKFARRLAGKYSLTPQDREDIEQELLFKLSKNPPAATPDTPQWKAYVSRGLRCAANNWLRDNEAAKRDCRRTRSLHAHVNAGDGDDRPTVLAETIVAHEVPSRRLAAQRRDQDRIDLAIDMEAYVVRLPDQRHREFCRRLMHHSISQIARDMNIPRSTLHGWKRQIRQELGKLGFLDYF